MPNRCGLGGGDWAMSRGSDVGAGVRQRVRMAWIRLHGGYTNARQQKAHSEEWAKCLNFLAPRPGLEPGTYGLTVRRSTD